MARTAHGAGNRLNSTSTEGYNRIPCNPKSPNTLFITRDTTRRVNLGDPGGRVLLNEYLGMSLKEYIQLLIEIFYLHNRKIDSSTFPLLLPQMDNGAAIKARVTQYLEDSDSLRGQLQTLQWVWDTNRASTQTSSATAPARPTGSTR